VGGAAADRLPPCCYEAAACTRTLSGVVGLGTKEQHCLWLSQEAGDLILPAPHPPRNQRRCGPARHAALLAKPGTRVWALDASGPMLDYARRLADGEGAAVEFVQGDMADFTLPVSDKGGALHQQLLQRGATASSASGWRVPAASSNVLLQVHGSRGRGGGA
jgi:SAM-dependent methyltransferase